MTSSATSSAKRPRVEFNGRCLPSQFISTWNNYTEADILVFRGWCQAKTTFSVVGREVAPTTGTPHLQGFHQTSGSLSFKAFKKVCNCNVTPVGKDNGCVPYCEKDDKVVIRTGEYLKKEQGKRSDLTVVAEYIEQGMTMTEIYQQAPEAVIRYGSGISRAISLQVKPRDRRIPKICWCFFGETGTGKTYRLYEHIESLGCEPYVWSNGMPTFWEGYEGHKHVIMDEYRAQLPMCNLLTLMHEYPTRVNVKYGHAQYVADFMYFTSSMHPRYWYPNISNDSTDQLLRRFGDSQERIVHIKSRGQVVEM